MSNPAAGTGPVLVAKPQGPDYRLALAGVSILAIIAGIVLVTVSTGILFGGWWSLLILGISLAGIGLLVGFKV